MLSVILPTAREIETSYFTETLRSLATFPEIEVICVAQSEAPTRAERLNLGFARSKGSMILFHHPRSLLDRQGVEFLIKQSEKKIWGGFTHQFDVTHPLLRFTSWYSNRMRAQGRGIIYLDHCIFFHRSLWLGPLAKVEIFEDTLLSQNLKIHSPPLILPFASTTSAIRFVKNGIFRQAIMNQILKLGFHFGIPHDTMNRIYERGLNLNTKR